MYRKSRMDKEDGKKTNKSKELTARDYTKLTTDPSCEWFKYPALF